MVRLKDLLCSSQGRGLLITKATIETLCHVAVTHIAEKDAANVLCFCEQLLEKVPCGQPSDQPLTLYLTLSKVISKWVASIGIRTLSIKIMRITL